MPIRSEPWRFFDPTHGVPDAANPPDDPSAVYQLDRQLDAGGECFRLLAPFAYLDRATGCAVVTPHDLPLGPAPVEAPATGEASDFKSDLTSVPAVFTWLVPKTGAHLPAALVHDSMIGEAQFMLVKAADGATGDGSPVKVIWRPGDTSPRRLTAVEADRIFRDAMADSGTGVIRRWLVWTAVTLRTIFTLDGTSESAWKRWWYLIVALATLSTIGWLGYQATAQIFGWTEAWPCAYELPWITSELPGPLDGLPWAGDGFGARFVSGTFWALVLPVLPGLILWGSFRRAGVITGIALAVLLHVTVALLALSAVYVVAEALVTDGWRGVRDLVTRRRPLTWLILGVAAVALAVIVVICRSA